MMAAPFNDEDGGGSGHNQSSQSIIDKKRSAHATGQQAARNRTQKLHPSMGSVSGSGSGSGSRNDPSDKVKSVMARLHEADTTDGVDLGDYYASPPPPPDSVGAMRSAGKEAMQNADVTSSPPPPSPSLPSSRPPPQPQSSSEDHYDLHHLQQNYGDEAAVHDYYRRYVPQYHPSQLQQTRGGVPPTATPSRTTPAWVQRAGSNALPPLPEESQLLEKLNYMIHLLEEKQDERTHHVAEEVVLYGFLGIFVIFIVDSFTRVGKYTR